MSHTHTYTQTLHLFIYRLMKVLVTSTCRTAIITIDPTITTIIGTTIITTIISATTTTSNMYAIYCDYIYI